MKKEYHLLDEVQRVTKLSHEELIHAGAMGRIKICVLAHDWLVNLYGIDINDTPNGPERVAEVKKSLTPYKVNGPIRLYAESLATLEASPKAKAKKFIASLDGNIDTEHDQYELRICPNDLADKDYDGLVIGDCRLVVMAEDLDHYVNATKAETEGIPTTRERNSLSLIIAALAHMSKTDLTKPSKAATAIEHQIELLGGRLSARSIEDHIKRIPVEYRKMGD